MQVGAARESLRLPPGNQNFRAARGGQRFLVLEPEWTVSDLTMTVVLSLTAGKVEQFAIQGPAPARQSSRIAAIR
ncbi:MAG: hypothetical protein ACKV2U_30455 [Bryobacteraceae bacterium]